MEDLRIDQTAQIIRNIQSYMINTGLYYGTKPPDLNLERHSPSWMIAEHPFIVSSGEAEFLQTELPRAIWDFHFISAEILKMALIGAYPQDVEITVEAHSSLRQIKKGWERSISGPYAELRSELAYSQLAADSVPLPFSTRPDLQMDCARQMRVIEYNTDGNADKGNTYGVNVYTREFQNVQILGQGLAEKFVEAIANRANGNRIVVATVLPVNYRTEYNAQNRYFSNRANELAEQLGYDLSWIAVPIDQLELDETGVYVSLGGERVKVNMIDREFELPGPGRDQSSFSTEVKLAAAIHAGRVDLLGSMLHYGDKMLLSIIFNPDLENVIVQLLGGNVEGVMRLNKLRQVHAETGYLAGEGQEVFILNKRLDADAIKAQQADWVIKRAGEGQVATESKGVIIGADLDRGTWGRAVDNAFYEGGWIVQKFYPSIELPVRARKNFRSTRTQINPNSRFRIAPYYVAKFGACSYELGNALVTAGIYPDQKSLREKNNIHAQRGTTYMPLSVAE